MSTIASPRPSISASSRRASTSTDTANTQSTAVDRGTLRRNRAALRDYYGLKATEQPDAPATPSQASFETDRESELDRPDFDPSTYVSELLAKESIDGVLKTEASLVSEIRSLDGEKKALVYDNYSKLIAATDTIKNMREKMDPLTPTTSTLTPAIGHIAETASILSNELRSSHGVSSEAQSGHKDQKDTVRWVLGAPGRLGKLVEGGRKEEAESQWENVSRLLNKWDGVRGVDEVRRACLVALGREDET